MSDTCGNNNKHNNNSDNPLTSDRTDGVAAEIGYKDGLEIGTSEKEYPR